MGSFTAGIPATGWAAHDNSGVLSSFSYTLRVPGPDDICLRVLYCGICHSDLHQLRNDFGASRYPMVAGHEIVGVVTLAGENVKDFKEGDHIGVGLIVGSCGCCDACFHDMEQYCKKKKWTYNDVYYDELPAYGGFASSMVVNQKFVVRIPAKLPLDKAAPLLCAGITVYSPMKYFGMNEPGKKCGVVGLGGVGHMAVKFAKAFGLHVTVISSSASKEKEALQILGADSFLVSSDEKQIKEAEETLDYILDTVPVAHPLDPYLSLLRTNGKLVMLGVVTAPLQVVATRLIQGRKTITGSFVGGVKETQEMLEFCAENKVECMIEKVSVSYINEAFERMAKNDVRYRFVVEMET